MKEGWNQFVDFLFDCIFPHYCLSCGKLDIYFCASCQTAEWFAHPPGIFDYPDNLVPDQVVSLTRYTAGHSVARLIEDFKYSWLNQSSQEIGHWLKNTLWLKEKIGECDIIIPIPLHKRRLAERGFNQAEVIAHYISLLINRQLCDSALIRTRSTKQQATLNRTDRIKNVVAAFKCVNQEKIVAKNILLVDDVYTTGSTMRECAKVLLAAGAKTVSGFTLARG